MLLSSFNSPFVEFVPKVRCMASMLNISWLFSKRPTRSTYIKISTQIGQSLVRIIYLFINSLEFTIRVFFWFWENVHSFTFWIMEFCSHFLHDVYGKFNCLLAGELFKNVTSVITKWKKLLKYYLHSIDEEVGTYTMGYHFPLIGIYKYSNIILNSKSVAVSPKLLFCYHIVLQFLLTVLPHPHFLQFPWNVCLSNDQMSLWFCL